MQVRIIMTKGGLETVALGGTPYYAFTVCLESDWEAMESIFIRQGGLEVGRLELDLPTREQAITLILPHLDAEKAAIMQKAYEECQKVETRKQNVLSLPAPLKQPVEVNPFSDDIPF